MAAEHDEVPLNAIRAFVTIAREGSVTRAANALGTTQSSVSRYLACCRTISAQTSSSDAVGGAN
ncbi:helix-turn-helix domain-containing protein [Bradyrhizobium sp. I1.14.4]|uniref:helix-turn-helix domain-containing protein n=1 Tax=unclassified Bradyrhizobium TaxID=2631580 RepID=UPI003D2049AA